MSKLETKIVMENVNFQETCLTFISKGVPESTRNFILLRVYYICFCYPCVSFLDTTFTLNKILLYIC